MSDYVMNRESLKRHCEAMCEKFKTVPDSGTYGEHRLVLELLEQTAWIPITERLPEGEGVVLVNVCVKDEPHPPIILTSIKDVKRCVENGWIDAWMPLPKPYKEGEER